MLRLVPVCLLLAAAGFLVGLSVDSVASCITRCLEEDQTIFASGVLVERIDDSIGEPVEMPDQIELRADVYGSPEVIYVGDLTFTVLR